MTMRRGDAVFSIERARYSRGFSLVEMMIALAMGLLLISGMITIVFTTNRTSGLNRALATIQEDARFALDIISSDIRVAGFQGCSTIAETNLTVKAINAPIEDFSQGLKTSAIWLSSVASATSWEPALPWGSSFTIPTSNPAVIGTNVLALQFGDPEVYSLETAVGITTPDPSGIIRIVGNPAEINIRTGELAIISDCQGGDLFQVTGTSSAGTTALDILHAAGTSTNSSDSLTAPYGSSDVLLRQSKVMRLNTNVYYVGDTGLDNQNGADITALYLQTYPFTASNPPIELVQGVEQLAVTFTQVDESGNTIKVTSDDAAFDPSRVQAVGLGVLLSSFGMVADINDSKTYVIAGKSVVPATGSSTGDFTHAGDRRLRLAFNTTVKMRNMRPQE